jgi:hypothetical protein
MPVRLGFLPEDIGIENSGSTCERRPRRHLPGLRPDGSF